jgi:hypothetical protein
MNCGAVARFRVSSSIFSDVCVPVCSCASVPVCLDLCACLSCKYGCSGTVQHGRLSWVERRGDGVLFQGCALREGVGDVRQPRHSTWSVGMDAFLRFLCAPVHPAGFYQTPLTLGWNVVSEPLAFPVVPHVSRKLEPRSRAGKRAS